MQPSLLKYSIKIYSYSKTMHIPAIFYWKLNVLLRLAKCLDDKAKRNTEMAPCYGIFCCFHPSYHT